RKSGAKRRSYRFVRSSHIGRPRRASPRVRQQHSSTTCGTVYPCCARGCRNRVMNAKYHQRRRLDLPSGRGGFRACFLPSLEASSPRVRLSEDLPKREDGDDPDAPLYHVCAGWHGGGSRTRIEAGQPEVTTRADYAPRPSAEACRRAGAAPESYAEVPGRKAMRRLRNGVQGESSEAEAKQVLRACLRLGTTSRRATKASCGRVAIVPQ